MKKLVLLLSVVLIFSCKKEKDSIKKAGENTNNSSSQGVQFPVVLKYSDKNENFRWWVNGVLQSNSGLDLEQFANKVSNDFFLDAFDYEMDLMDIQYQFHDGENLTISDDSASDDLNYVFSKDTLLGKIPQLGIEVPLALGGYNELRVHTGYLYFVAGDSMSMHRWGESGSNLISEEEVDEFKSADTLLVFNGTYYFRP